MKPVVVVLVNDLIFESKVRACARAVEVEVRVLRAAPPEPSATTEYAGAIVDLHLESSDPIEFVREWKARCPDDPIVGFFSHVHADVARRARAAGCDDVLPRSTFVEKLPEILRRLGGSKDSSSHGAGVDTSATPG